MDDIVWKDIIDNSYEISNTGLVRNRKTKHIRKLTLCRGYLTVGLVVKNEKTETKNI